MDNEPQMTIGDVDAFRDRFRSVLAEFQGNDDVASVFPLSESSRLTTTLLAWRRIVVRIVPTADEPPDDEVGRWRWLWSRCRYRRTDVAKAIGAKPADARRYLDVLIANRLIFPDGTVHARGEQFACGVAARALKRMAK